MKKVSLKKGLELVGFSNISINKGYNYRSGFAEFNGQLYYFSTTDLRFSKPTMNVFLLVRKDKDRQDFKGDANEYWVVRKLEQLGYRFAINRSRGDFNDRSEYEYYKQRGQLCLN